MHPDTNVVVNDCDPCAVATEKVVADLHKDKIITVGAGGSKVGVDAIKAGKQFGDTVILPATEAKAATLMAIKAARKQPVGDTTIDVTKDLSPGRHDRRRQQRRQVQARVVRAHARGARLT